MLTIHGSQNITIQSSKHLIYEHNKDIEKVEKLNTLVT